MTRTRWGIRGSEARFEEMLFDIMRQGMEGQGGEGPRGLATDEEIVKAFHRIWAVVEEEMDLSLDSEEALKRMPELVVYDIPDGTRSTLSVTESVDVGQDAALFCIALVHTLRALGARKAILMTHTSYNRARGQEGTQRFLKLIQEGLKPLAAYARASGVNLIFMGMGEEYELKGYLEKTLPPVQPGNFDAIFLTDYSEDYFLGEGRGGLPQVPEVDVCIRHTKMTTGGGWIPERMLRSTFLYCQNGSLFSNWRYDELVALVALALVAKLFHSGEGLAKVYGDVDEVKRRHQMRELRLFHKTVQLSARPRKLFLVGSPIGVYTVMA